MVLNSSMLNHLLQAIGKTTKAMITNARLEMDERLDRVSRSVMNFFENDLSSTHLGLHQVAREHFDRFRSFLHGFYIEQHGFWPPQGFDDDSVRKSLYATMYSDFRNLYHHLVDLESTPSMAINLSASGGVCTLQNVQAFDQRHGYEALSHPLPVLPKVASPDPAQIRCKRGSLNPLKKSKLNRDAKIEAEMQALIDSSNRDWNIMKCLLVRRYSDFEQCTVFDDFEQVSVVDGRKVRWILIYTILQTLISVMQAPTQVRNTEGLDYSLCCHAPKIMPWRLGAIDSPPSSHSSAEELVGEKVVELEPDNNYLHTNSSSSSLSKERRQSLPPANAGLSGNKSPPDSRPSSFKRLLTRRSPNTTAKSDPSPKQPPFCEIFVEGYGNGLNEVKIESSTKPAVEAEDPADTLLPTSPKTSVSRESSNASGYSNRSSGTTSSSSGDTPDMDHLSVVDSGEDVMTNEDGTARNEKNEVGKIYFNTETWDKVLGVL